MHFQLVALPIWGLLFVLAQIYITDRFLKNQIRLFSAVGAVITAFTSVIGVVILVAFIILTAVIFREQWEDKKIF